MLILTRKAGETIKLGDDIVITVTQVRGAQVHIGIDAPRDINIRRGELDERKSSICFHGVDKRRPCFQCQAEDVNGNR